MKRHALLALVVLGAIVTFQAAAHGMKWAAFAGFAVTLLLARRWLILDDERLEALRRVERSRPDRW